MNGPNKLECRLFLVLKETVREVDIWLIFIFRQKSYSKPNISY